MIDCVCSNYKLYLLENEIPSLSSTYTQLVFPIIPEELLILTQLEERFLSPHTGFPIITLLHVSFLLCHPKPSPNLIHKFNYQPADTKLRHKLAPLRAAKKK